jgi:hypothetical protein
MRSRGRHHLSAVLAWRWVALSALGAASVVACSHPGRGAAVPANGCAPALNERLDSRSTVHLFPSAPEPTYLTDPPTSGPHRLGPPFRGVVNTPIPRSSQVAMLESGFVIVQSRVLPASQAAGVDRLAADLVTVAPPAGPLPSAIVVTAWTWKLECGSADPPALAAIHAFIATHQGVGFAGNIPTTTFTS